ncbi:hypothetical protein BCY76_014340 [Nesterenkonia sp. PF2B19]|nr:hypothetical protein BCY76_014340 [Nesterenkonia sp. PF2B19]
MVGAGAQRRRRRPAGAGPGDRGGRRRAGHQPVREHHAVPLPGLWGAAHGARRDHGADPAPRLTLSRDGPPPRRFCTTTSRLHRKIC